MIDNSALFLLPSADGGAFIQELDARGFDFVAGFWLYQSEFDDWRLIIATPLVETGDARPAYRQLQQIIAATEPPLDLSLSNVTAVSPKNEIVRALRKVYHVTKGQKPVRVRRSIHDGVVVEDALIYRMV